MSQEDSVQAPEENLDQGVQASPEPATEETAQAIGTDETVQALEQELAAFRAENQKLQAEIAEIKEQFMRKAAEMDNFRKRLIRDKEEAVLFANKEILADLVPVIDNFERAIKSSEAAKDYESLYKGIVMIESQFTSMLDSKYGLKRLQTLGQPFDPSFHEAVMMEDNPDHTESMVLESYEAGYVLQEKVLRTAKVKVSRPGK